MCCKLNFVVVLFPGVTKNDSVTAIGTATYSSAVPVATLPTVNSQFFLDKNDDDGVECLYAIKTTSAPLAVTFTTAGSVTGSSLIGPHRPHRPSIFEYQLSQ